MEIVIQIENKDEGLIAEFVHRLEELLRELNLDGSIATGRYFDGDLKITQVKKNRCKKCGEPLILIETRILGICLECLKKEKESGDEQIFSLKGKSIAFKIALLHILGYNSDGTFVLERNGDKHLDKYTKEVVRLDNLAILSDKNGKVAILDCNPLSISSFLECESEEK